MPTYSISNLTLLLKNLGFQTLWKHEHILLSESENSKSGIVDHAAQKNHIIDWTNPKVLCKESDYRSRQIRESIWIWRKSPDA